MTSPKELADAFHEQWLATHPFAATSYGIPGYDHLLPDESDEGADTWRQKVEVTVRQIDDIDMSGLDEAEEITLGCLRQAALAELSYLDGAYSEHTVTAMPFSGPAVFLAVSARTLLDDEKAAGDYIARLAGSGTLIDQLSERLRSGGAKGRLPVAPLVEQAIGWAETVLAQDVPVALSTPQPPDGWEKRDSFVQERDEIARSVVKPALGRWVELLKELLPRARPAEQPGLTYLPGGDADYARAITLHTTLPLTAEQLHQTGLGEIEMLEQRLTELGAKIGLQGVPAIHEALRNSSTQLIPDEAIEAAVTAIRRAESVAPQFFPAPLPPPCAVTPMPTVVGESGMAPHYTPPRLGGGRPGTYWFNVDRPTAGAGWDLEGVAFHEAVPGHHLQLSRLQLLTELPAMQRQRSVTVFSEGWGLYAEQLAEEMGLYSSTESLLGAVTASLMRAARLVLDTGIHSFGWSRQQALEFYTAHVPMPLDFLASEIDRYIILPGQALAYLTGKLEILRLREGARRQMKGAFSLPDFHSAVLDSGSLPMPVLRQKIERWAAGA